jgi:tetratricopeptide (TPR) repeat protein
MELRVSQRQIALSVIGTIIGGLFGIGAEPFAMSRLLNVVGTAFWTGVIGYVLGGAAGKEWRRIGAGMTIGAVLALGIALRMGAWTFATITNTFFAMFIGGLIGKNWAWRGAADAVLVGGLIGGSIGLGISLAERKAGLDLLVATGGGAIGFAIFLVILKGVFGFGQRKSAGPAEDTPQARIQACTQILILDRTNSEAYYNRGKAYAQLGKIELARADFQRAHENSGDPHWHALAEQALRQLDQEQ